MEATFKFQNLKLGPPNSGLFTIDETIQSEIRNLQIKKRQGFGLYLGTEDDQLKRSVKLQQLYKNLSKTDEDFKLSSRRNKKDRRVSTSSQSDVDQLYNQMIENTEEEQVIEAEDQRINQGDSAELLEKA